ncbi:hypothetical protein POSPLADRAFT_1074347 [Postia placenta MAD-698-R-SB12]|uniref:Uncharacterized protein n=1 Tax=Postia placenta MAD-698-R-SB12 TaxID=670580 RepID=A0A1X6N397_9APHY|nr:hypothetical protein POSPLADRAFT_1074347 [Postia placenta MAD-698-R-SB12]OSX63075.1 hypothetical protein POSPLADRAFT_1074347 [Postia placenta MAD-698-R-SB12]
MGDFNIERCSTLSPGARVGIGIAIAVVGLAALVAFGVSRQRRLRRQNLAYVPNGNSPQAYPVQGSPYAPPGGVYVQNTNSGYYGSYPPQYPQYPPPAHSGNGWDPQNGFAPPYQQTQPPHYSPPLGPPPQIMEKTRP